MPHLGLVRRGLLFGLLNVLVALWAMWLFREQLRNAIWLKTQAFISLAALGVSFALAGQFTSLAEAHLYACLLYTSRCV